MRSEVRFLLKAARPGFWLTAMWFYLLPLGEAAPLRTLPFWLGLLYVGFPMGMLIYAGNDVTDTKTDELNPRKDSWLFGARPTAAQIQGLPLRIFLAQLPFVVIFTVLLGPKAIGWFIATAIMSLAYNARNGAKDRAGFDVLAQAAFVGVFLLSSWLCSLPLASWPVWVFGALFAMHSHLFGQIMDLEPDKLGGRTTTAIWIGPRRTKILISVLLCVEALLALTFTAKPWLAPIMAFSAVWFALDNLVIWKEKAYATWQAALFFLGWNLFLVAETAFSFAYWNGLLARFISL